MSPASAPTSQLIAEMRHAFDAGFAAPAGVAEAQDEQLLAVRAGGAPYALRLAELAGIVPARRIVRLPSAVPAALGLSGVRGVLVPVFSLAALLTDRDDTEEPSWLALCHGEQQVALAFAELEGHLRVGASSLHPLDAATAPHTPHVVRVGTISRAVVSIPRVVETITRRVGPGGRPQE